MDVLGHDNVILDGDHGVVRGDGVEQLVLHHLPEGGEGDAGCIGAAIGRAEVAHHGTEGVAEVICHMQGDVVDARSGVVMSRCAAGHAVLGGIPFFHFFFLAGKTGEHSHF